MTGGACYIRAFFTDGGWPSGCLPNGSCLRSISKYQIPRLDLHNRVRKKGAPPPHRAAPAPFFPERSKGLGDGGREQSSEQARRNSLHIEWTEPGSNRRPKDFQLLVKPQFSRCFSLSDFPSVHNPYRILRQTQIASSFRP